MKKVLLVLWLLIHIIGKTFSQNGPNSQDQYELILKQKGEMLKSMVNSPNTKLPLIKRNYILSHYSEGESNTLQFHIKDETTDQSTITTLYNPVLNEINNKIDSYNSQQNEYKVYVDLTINNYINLKQTTNVTEIKDVTNFIQNIQNLDESSVRKSNYSEFDSAEKLANQSQELIQAATSEGNKIYLISIFFDLVPRINSDSATIELELVKRFLIKKSTGDGGADELDEPSKSILLSYLKNINVSSPDWEKELIQSFLENIDEMEYDSFEKLYEDPNITEQQNIVYVPKSSISCSTFQIGNSFVTFTDENLAKINQYILDGNQLQGIVDNNDEEAKISLQVKEKKDQAGNLVPYAVYKTFELLYFDRMNKDNIQRDSFNIDNNTYYSYKTEKVNHSKYRFGILEEIKCKDSISIFDASISGMCRTISATECDSIKNNSGNGNGDYAGSTIIIDLTGLGIDTVELGKLYSGAKSELISDTIMRRALKVCLIITSNPSQYDSIIEKKIPKGYIKVWLNYTNNKFTVQAIDTQRFESLPLLAAFNGISQKKLITNIVNLSQVADTILTELYLFLDLVSNKIEKCKIDQKYWNCNNTDTYDKFYSDIAYVFLKPIFLSIELIINSSSIIWKDDPAENKEYFGSEAQFSAVCGIWDGLVGIIQSVPDVLSIFPKVLSVQGRNEIKTQFQQLQNYKRIDTTGVEPIVVKEGIYYAILDGLKDHFDINQNCLFVHNVTELIGPVVIAIFVPSASKSVLGVLLKPLVKIMAFSDKIDIVGQIGSKVAGIAFKSTGKVVKRIAYCVNENVIIKIKKGEEFIVKEVTLEELGKKIDEVDQKYDGQHILPLDNVFYTKHEVLNQVIQVIKSGKVQFNPVYYQKLEELIGEYRTKFKDGTWQQFLEEYKKVIPEENLSLEVVATSEHYFNYKKEGPGHLNLTQESFDRILSKYPGKKHHIEALFVNIAPENAKKLAADLEDVAFGTYLVDKVEGVKAWEKSIARPIYRKDVNYLSKLSELMEPSVVNKFPNGQTDIDNIIAALVHPQTGGTHPFLKNVADHLDDVKYLAVNLNEVDGFSKVVAALKNTNFYAQDGVSHMLTKLKTIDPSKVRKLEGKILDADNLDGICENCLFDIEYEAGPGLIKKLELKSYSQSTINNILFSTKFKNQFKAYLANANNMNSFEYIFNSKKVNDLNFIKSKFKELFQQDNYKIYDDILKANPNSTVFSSIGINTKGQFIQAVNKTGHDHDLYNFINKL